VRGDRSTVTETDRSEDRVRLLGLWSARTIFVLEVAYVAVFVAGFASIGNTSRPLPDPYLGIAEGIILVMAPILVALMLAINAQAPQRAKPYTQVALGWMMAAAAFTTVVHFVELTVARHIHPASVPGYDRIFDFKWPSTFYAIDIAAWDVFFALAVLFAVPAFARRGDSLLVRRGLIATGSLSLIGLIGPFANALGWRTIGILGYTVVFALTCIPLSRVFKDDKLIQRRSPERIGVGSDITTAHCVGSMDQPSPRSRHGSPCRVTTPGPDGTQNIGPQRPIRDSRPSGIWARFGGAFPDGRRLCRPCRSRLRTAQVLSARCANPACCRRACPRAAIGASTCQRIIGGMDIDVPCHAARVRRNTGCLGNSAAIRSSDASGAASKYGRVTGT
jgi:hypothetical protein